MFPTRLSRSQLCPRPWRGGWGGQSALAATGPHAHFFSISNPSTNLHQNSFKHILAQVFKSLWTTGLLAQALGLTDGCSLLQDIYHTLRQRRDQDSMIQTTCNRSSKTYLTTGSSEVTDLISYRVLPSVTTINYRPTGCQGLEGEKVPRQPPNPQAL